MKLNHDIYREAMDPIRLSDDVGMKLVEEAMQQRQQRRQGSNWHAVAVAAVFLMVGFGLNGICYAQTGKNMVEMFSSLFENDDLQEMAELMEGARESGESFTYENLKFTLESYWYDKENAEAIFTMRVDSLDGTPMDEEEMERNYIIMEQSSRFATWNRVYNGDKTSFLEYHCVEAAFDKEGDPIGKDGDFADHMGIDICLYEEEDCPVIGSFTLEPTDELRARYVDFSFLEGCNSKARITGTGWKLRFDTAFRQEDEPFRKVDVVMKDGTVYRSGFNTSCEVLPIYNADDELLNADELKDEPERAKLHQCGYSFVENSQEGEGFVFHVPFKNFINIDEIEAVYMDGVELPIE